MTEMASPDGSWRPTAALLDWAFAYGPSEAPIGALVDPGDPVMPKPTLAPGVRPQSVPIAAPRVSARPTALAPWIAMTGGIGVLALARSFSRRGTSVRRR
jgi:D-alanyl-D-alanine carboxypeptidase (penicillin-binding protein 5/6)